MPVKHLLPDNFHIGINVSAGCFLAAGFEKECLNLVKKLGNDKIKLVLELTERNPIPVTPEARAIFDSLHQHNITFALDDFGTGYATYRYLQAFPVDFIKIDKSFVQMASVDEISGHIVDNIVELARKAWSEYRGGRGRNPGAGGFNDRQRRSLFAGLFVLSASTG